MPWAERPTRPQGLPSGGLYVYAMRTSIDRLDAKLKRGGYIWLGVGLWAFSWLGTGTLFDTCRLLGFVSFAGGIIVKLTNKKNNG